jgi:hypothetical protein
VRDLLHVSSFEWRFKNLPALKVANTAKIAVEDAVPAPVSEANPPMPAASAGAASPPVTANTVPRLPKTMVFD